jgi:hypothetical protein
MRLAPILLAVLRSCLFCFLQRSWAHGGTNTSGDIDIWEQDHDAWSGGQPNDYGAGSRAGAESTERG